jgi:hypothetical protein
MSHIPSVIIEAFHGIYLALGIHHLASHLFDLDSLFLLESDKTLFKESVAIKNSLSVKLKVGISNYMSLFKHLQKDWKRIFKLEDEFKNYCKFVKEVFSISSELLQKVESFVHAIKKKTYAYDPAMHQVYRISAQVVAGAVAVGGAILTGGALWHLFYPAKTHALCVLGESTLGVGVAGVGGGAAVVAAGFSSSHVYTFGNKEKEFFDAMMALHEMAKAHKLKIHVFDDNIQQIFKHAKDVSTNVAVGSSDDEIKESDVLEFQKGYEFLCQENVADGLLDDFTSIEKVKDLITKETAIPLLTIQLLPLAIFKFHYCRRYIKVKHVDCGTLKRSSTGYLSVMGSLLGSDEKVQ